MKKLILILTAAIMTVSCSDNLEDLNQNIKDPTSVSGESLFASAQKQLADQITTPNVNLNNLRLWVQYQNETTYTDETNYNQITRAIPDNHWRELYRDVLKDLDEAAIIISEIDNDLTNAQKPNKLAIIEVLTVYAYANLVETYGNIPYTEALDIDNLLPAYDDAEEVYTDLISRLNTAIGNMDPSISVLDSSTDLMYGGDVASWKKFANSLKLRMGIMLADANASLSQSTVESAVSSGVFASNSDNALYNYPGAAPNNNPINDNLVLSGRNDFVAAETIIDKMLSLEDPRIATYFDDNLQEFVGTVVSTSVSGTVTTITFDGAVVGDPAVGDIAYTTGAQDDIVVGEIVAVGGSSIDIESAEVALNAGDLVTFLYYKGGAIGSLSPHATHTNVSKTVTEGAAPGVFMDYAEVEFLLAEAAARGYSVGGDAESHYVAGITASFEDWGASGLTDYLANPAVDYTTAIAASTSSPAWKEVIGTQAWLGLYNRTFASYLSVRRLDYPILIEPNSPESGFPVRYTYPVIEQTLNGTNYDAAASAIGGDAPETQLFWDKFYTFDF